MKKSIFLKSSSAILLTFAMFGVSLGANTQQQNAINRINSLKVQYSTKLNNIKTTDQETKNRINLKKTQISELAKSYTDKIKEKPSNTDSLINELENLYKIKSNFASVGVYKLDSNLIFTDKKQLEYIIQNKINTINKSDGYNITISTNQKVDEVKDTISKQQNNFSLNILFTDSEQNIIKITFPKNSYIGQEIQSDLDNNYLIKQIFGYDVIAPTAFKYQSTSTFTIGEDINSLRGLYNIKADKYQEELSKKSKILVGIIDTGIDYFHKDIKPNIFKNTKEIDGNNIDDDDNGFIDDVYGYNFVDNNNNSIDKNGHGTHIAGTIGGAINMVGIYGVNSNSNLLSIKTIDNNGYGSDIDIAQGIKYAVNNGAKVINLSVAGNGSQDNIICKAINYANSKGVLVISAAGNNSENAMYTIPGVCKGTINVGAHDGSNIKSNFSNFGNSVTVYAPGTSINSSIPGDQYNYMQGTSMAAAHVSGLASALLAYNQNIGYEDLVSILKNGGKAIAIRGEDTVGVGIDMEKAIKTLGTMNIEVKKYSETKTQEEQINVDQNYSDTDNTQNSQTQESTSTNTTSSSGTKFSNTNSLIGISCERVSKNKYSCKGTGTSTQEKGMKYAFFVNGKLVSQDSLKTTIKISKDSYIRFTTTSDKKYNYSEIRINFEK